MVTITIHCPHCGSDALVRDGHAPSRQVVAYAVGDRSKKTCQRLWEAIPQGYRLGQCFTDFLRVYASVIPEAQHTAVGKETEKPPMWSAGTLPRVNASLVLFV